MTIKKVGIRLENEKTLKDYDILKESSTIHCVVPLRGC